MFTCNFCNDIFDEKVDYLKHLFLCEFKNKSSPAEDYTRISFLLDELVKAVIEKENKSEQLRPCGICGRTPMDGEYSEDLFQCSFCRKNVCAECHEVHYDNHEYRNEVEGFLDE